MEENNDINQYNYKTYLINENVNEDKENKENVNKELLQTEKIDTDNKNIVITNQEIINTNTNQNQENENQTRINDYIITIQYSKFLCIPYFYFRNIIYFYFPCQSFLSNKIKLSELPTPPFAVIRSECKLL